MIKSMQRLFLTVFNMPLIYQTPKTFFIFWSYYLVRSDYLVSKNIYFLSRTSKDILFNNIHIFAMLYVLYSVIY